MKVNLKQIATKAIFVAAVTTAFASASFAQSAVAEAAQQALATQMGDSAKDLTVDVQDGVAQLRGWTDSPSEVDKARYLVSKVPGVKQSYSIHVHTWSSDSNS
jgi:osmotically-inducible protein OsmY